jgi:hypothetical protein
VDILSGSYLVKTTMSVGTWGNRGDTIKHPCGIKHPESNPLVGTQSEAAAASEGQTKQTHGHLSQCSRSYTRV